MHYVDITSLRLASSLEKAGYFERNRRMVPVLIDQDAVMEGLSQEGDPWKYYDLGHGLCSYYFFDQCPHRIACTGCDFSLPKSGAHALMLESKAPVRRYLEEVPLTPDEQVIAQNDLEKNRRLYP